MRRRLILWGATLSAFVFALSLMIASGNIQSAEAQTRTWFYMPTGNGHGFQIFDRREGKITYFLEHPYRFVAPSGTNLPVDRTTPGVGRRDLAHDMYFGASVNGEQRWFNRLTDSISYLDQSNIITASDRLGGVSFQHYFYAPFGLEANAFIMLVKASGPAGAQVKVFAKPNLQFGLSSSRTEPTDNNEELNWLEDEQLAIETGEGGGHAVYLPLGDFSQVALGRDDVLYQNVLGRGEITSSPSCSGTNCVFVSETELTLDENGEGWAGLAVLFVNDNPNHPQANAFKDERNVDDVISLWREFAGEKTPKEFLDFALAEWEEWRVDKAPSDFSEEERKIWRQSESVLRMGQVRETAQNNRFNMGMFLAALPIGEWHTGWVRDGAYAVVSMAMNGHFEEARIGAEFYLNAEKGIFPELGDQYRVSSCRYFGNGQEEADGNHAGPNLETDGWGLVLWAAAMYLHYSCDLGWLDQTTRYGDTVFEALHNIAQDIDGMIEESTGLPKAEASIWEVHWDLRQTFTYTAAAQARGLYDFAQIAYAAGREDLANEYWTKATRMHEAIKDQLVYRPLNSLASHRGVANQDVHVDGSTVEALHWGLISPDDPVFVGTLSLYDRLKTNQGGYRRLEPALSLTGESGANEYDLSQWILLDLRIGDMWRLVGNNNRADELLDRITEDAVVNDNLVPELYEPNSGEYAGVVPMVGYGAGAWQMSQLFKHGQRPPSFGVGYESCLERPPMAGVEMMGGESMSAGTEAMAGTEMTAGTEMNNNQTTGGSSSNPGSFMPPTPVDDEATSDFDWAKEDKASLCDHRAGQSNLLIMLWLCLGVVLLRRKTLV